MIARRSLFIVLLGVLSTAALAEKPAGTLVTLEPRPGVTQGLWLIKTEKPWASVVLLPGGNGDIELGADGPKKKGNFLVRTRDQYAQQGLNVAVLDASSDAKGPAGLGDRTGKDHAADLKAVMMFMRQQAAVPVWLIGTSRGTVSAANAAARLDQDGPDGIVLTSTLSQARHATDVFDVDLKKVKVPVLLVHHEQDACDASPYANLSRIAHNLSNAPIVKILHYTGGESPRSGPCEPFAYHGYLGIEPEVVHDIVAWIKQPTRD